MENIASGSRQLPGVYTQQTSGHLSALDSSTLIDNRSHATLLRRDYALGIKNDVDGVKNNNTIEEKAYISSQSSDGYQPLLWREDLYGIPRTAVHGKDSICVVVRREDLSSLRGQVFKEVHPEMDNQYWNEVFNLKFGNAAIYEVEEHAGRYFESFKKPRGIKVPFCVVSSKLGGINMMCDKASGDEVAIHPPIDDVGHPPHQASSAEYDADNAIKFLQEAMNSGKTFTYVETLKTAKSAIDRMFSKNFKRDEIQAFVLRRKRRGDRKRKKGMTSRGAREKLSDFQVEELPVERELSIKDIFNMYNIESYAQNIYDF